MTSEVFTMLVNGALVTLILAGTGWLLLRTLNSRGTVRAATTYVVWSLALAAVFVAHVLVSIVLFGTDSTAPSFVELEPTSAVSAPETAGMDGPGTTVRGASVASVASVASAENVVPAASVGEFGINSSATVPTPEPSGRVSTRVTLNAFAAWISSAAVWSWFVILAFNIVRLGVGTIKLHGIARRAQPFSPRDVRRYLETATRRGVDIRRTDELDSPVAAGLFHPSILVPSTLCDHMSAEQLRPLILHEAAHIARRDNWSLLFQRVAEALFFFNPAVMWMTARMHDAREAACDVWVISRTNHPRAYVSSIAQLLELRIGNRTILTAPGLDGSKSEFLRRMHRIMNDRIPDSPSLSREQVAIAASIVTLVIVAVFTFRPFVTIAFEGSPQSATFPAHVMAAPPAPPAPPAAPVPTSAPVSSAASVRQAALVRSAAPVPPAASVQPGELVQPSALPPRQAPHPVASVEPHAGAWAMAANVSMLSPLPRVNGSTADLSAKSWIRLIAVASGISSDGDKARVLARAAERIPDDERVYTAFLSAVESVQSSGDASRVLLALLRRTTVDKLSFERVLETAKSIRSSGDQSRVILAIVRVAPQSLVRTESFRDVALAGLPSSASGRVARELESRN